LAEQRGKTVEAERLYKSILEKSPQNKTVIHRLAVIEAKKGRFQEADQYFDQALQLDPDDPAILSDAGYCQFLQHRPSQAEGLYRRALEIDAGHQSATNNLAMLLGERGDDQAALRLFRQTGTEAQAQTNMGFVYSRRGDIAKAKAAYSQALTLDPKSMVAAEALVQLSKFEKHAEKTIAQSTEPAQPWAGGVASAAASASPVVEGWPAPQNAVPQRFEPERASVQAFTPASVSRPVVYQPEPAIAANTAEYVSTGRPDPAIRAVAYPDPPLAAPFDSAGIQAGDWPQSGVGMESTDAAMQAIASGFHAR
jgi:Flp pilus assembly protein TadD